MTFTLKKQVWNSLGGLSTYRYDHNIKDEKLDNLINLLHAYWSEVDENQ